MADTGLKYPTSSTTISISGAGASWNNINRIYVANDGQYAWGGAGGYSNYIVGLGFGFSIPTNVTINGIIATINRSAQNSTCVKDYSLKLVVGGSVSGNDKANTASYWPSSWGTANYGSISDTWGLTLSASDVNSSNFGLALSSNHTSGNGYIDYFSLTIYYTVIPTYIKTINGLAKASVKIVNGLAIASIKGIDGLT